MVTGSRASVGAETKTGRSPLPRGSGDRNEGYGGIGKLKKKKKKDEEWGRGRSHRGNKGKEVEERVSKGEKIMQTKR